MHKQETYIANCQPVMYLSYICMYDCITVLDYVFLCMWMGAISATFCTWCNPTGMQSSLFSLPSIHGELHLPSVSNRPWTEHGVRYAWSRPLCFRLPCYIQSTANPAPSVTVQTMSLLSAQSYHLQAHDPLSFVPQQWLLWYGWWAWFQHASDVKTEPEDIQANSLIYLMGGKAEEVYTVVSVSIQLLVVREGHRCFRVTFHCQMKCGLQKSSIQLPHPEWGGLCCRLHRFTAHPHLQCECGTLHDRLLHDCTVIAACG